MIDELEETIHPEQEKFWKPEILALRKATRFAYDMQKLRIQQGNRGTTDDVQLDEAGLAFLERSSNALKEVEKDSFKEVERLLKTVPIYKHWLRNQRGVGPAMAGVLLSTINIAHADSPSRIWSFAGLAVDPATGKAVRRVKGQKANYSPWFKSKVVKVLGESFIKSNSPWRKFYNRYKFRKSNMRVPCMLCMVDGQPTGMHKGSTCTNCKGCKTGPWGRSDAHRHQAAIRYMVKMFLLELYRQWRTLEGLPLRETYAELYLSRAHHESISPQGLPVRPMPYKLTPGWHPEAELENWEEYNDPDEVKAIDAVLEEKKRAKLSAKEAEAEQAVAGE